MRCDIVSSDPSQIKEHHPTITVHTVFSTGELSSHPSFNFYRRFLTSSLISHFIISLFVGSHMHSWINSFRYFFTQWSNGDITKTRTNTTGGMFTTWSEYDWSYHPRELTTEILSRSCIFRETWMGPVCTFTRTRSYTESYWIRMKKVF